MQSSSLFEDRLIGLITFATTMGMFVWNKELLRDKNGKRVVKYYGYSRWLSVVLKHKEKGSYNTVRVKKIVVHENGRNKRMYKARFSPDQLWDFIVSLEDECLKT